LLGLALLVAGAALVVASLAHRRQPADLGEYFDDFGLPPVPVDELQQRLSLPLHRRLLRSVTDRGLVFLGQMTPSGYTESIRHKLLMAGSRQERGAERYVAAQAAGLCALGVAAVAYYALLHPSLPATVVVFAVLPVMGVLIPQARLTRRINQRKELILRDLPDTLDLLAISVEAGLGFEAALDIVCQHFSSPLAGEFALTLREMQLGLPRKDAFHNLRARTEVPELNSFILALLQGDALGIPIGRVLKTQAEEMRSQRRMWAREKAGKLPVKILFPLVAFIFPPIMVVVLGPAVGPILSAFK
jgi:tight adherence protein C